MRRSNQPRLPLVAALAAMQTAVGCVTVRSEPTPRESTLHPRIVPASPESSQPPPNLPTGTEPPVQPGAPVARPVPPTSSAMLRFSIFPLGTIEYDGQVLPLVSPDARFVVVQAGLAPTWPTLLALDNAVPAITTRLVVYQVEKTGLSPLQLPVLPEGAILGRSCDAEGFLIEQPRADGTRAIAKVAWTSGRVEWLADSPAINAHGVLSQAGDLAYTTRKKGSPKADLVIRTRDGKLRVRPAGDVGYLFPVYAGEPKTLFTLARSQGGIDLVALRDAPTSDADTAIAPVIATRSLSLSSDPALAYQCTAALQVPPPHAIALQASGAGSASDPAIPSMPGAIVGAGGTPLSLFVPDLGRTAEFDLASGSWNPLSEKSIAAVRSPIADHPGLFVAVPEGLVFTPTADHRAPAPARPAMARLLDTPYVPRATANPDLPLIVFGPAGPTKLTVMGVGLPPAETPAPENKPPENK
jgi:hypothetical protein